jgi:hypothetical protein
MNIATRELESGWGSVLSAGFAGLAVVAAGVLLGVNYGVKGFIPAALPFLALGLWKPRSACAAALLFGLIEIVPDSAFPYTVLKMLKSGLIIFASAAVVFRLIRERGRDAGQALRRLSAFFLFFVMFGLVNALFSTDTGLTGLYVVKMGSIFLFVFLAMKEFNSESGLRILVAVLLFSSVIVAFFVSDQLIKGETYYDEVYMAQVDTLEAQKEAEEHRGRVIGTFSNPNGLGEYSATLLPVFLGLLLFYGTPLLRFLSAGGMFLLLLSAVGSQSRGALISIALSGIVLVFMKNRKAAVALVAAGFAFLALYFPFLAGPMRLEEGFSGRISLWNDGLAVFAEMPLTGSGLGTLPQSHSMLIQQLAEMGIFSLPVWIIFFSIIVLVYFRTKIIETGITEALFLGSGASILATSFRIFWESGSVVGTGTFNLLFWTIVGIWCICLDRIRQKNIMYSYDEAN